jgi:hypothetical protein
MSGESIQNIFEEEDEEDEGWIDQYDLKIYIKEEKSTTVMSLETRRINGIRYDSS